jgi:hypothetical protein
MAAGDVDVRIVAVNTTDVDTAITAQRALMGISGVYMIASTGPENQQLLCVAIQDK